MVERESPRIETLIEQIQQVPLDVQKALIRLGAEAYAEEQEQEQEQHEEEDRLTEILALVRPEWRDQLRTRFEIGLLVLHHARRAARRGIHVDDVEGLWKAWAEDFSLSAESSWTFPVTGDEDFEEIDRAHQEWTDFIRSQVVPA